MWSTDLRPPADRLRIGPGMHDVNGSDIDANKPGRRLPSIAFGLERIGLIAVRAPILSCLILLALCIGAGFGIQRIKIERQSGTRPRVTFREAAARYLAGCIGKVDTADLIAFHVELLDPWITQVRGHPLEQRTGVEQRQATAEPSRRSSTLP